MLWIVGFQLLKGALIYESTANRLTGATFDDTEKAFYKIINPVAEEIRTVTANYTAKAWDSVIYVDTTAGNVTVTLPNTLVDGKRITVHKLVAANSMIVAGPTATGLVTSGFALAASETFGTRFTNIPYIWNGTYWHIYA
jgi:nitrous oxidase accessory protein NosD